jgi:16S rRNA (uracil1498-N3)-methyltransferase
MSIPRFFLADLPATGLATLSPEDAKHAHAVLRLQVSDSLQLFNGQGLVADAEIVRCQKSLVEIRILSSQLEVVEVGAELNLIVALPKGDRQKQMIDQLVQLGVQHLTPLDTSRGVAQPTDAALGRLERAVVETCKQCCRNRLMAIHAPTTIRELTNQTTPSIANRASLFAHPYGASQPIARLLDQGRFSETLQVVIGPEGGLTDEECQMFSEAGWSQASLGKTILRIETAAALVAAVWAAQRDERVSR